MRYMMFIKHREDYKIEEVPQSLFTAMGEFVGEAMKNGSIIDTAGLEPTKKGKKVRLSGGKLTVIDGPFAETKDLIAGWYVIDVDSYDRAIELAGELSAAPGAGGKPIHEWLEVRPLMNLAPTITE